MCIYNTRTQHTLEKRLFRKQKKVSKNRIKKKKKQFRAEVAQTVKTLPAMQETQV